MKQKIRTVDNNWLYRRAKALSTSNMKKYGCSLSPSSICFHLNKCIVCTINDDGMEIDYDKYKELYNEQQKYAEANRKR